MENILPFVFIGVVVLGFGYIIYRNYFKPKPPYVPPVPKPPVPPAPPSPPVV